MLFVGTEFGVFFTLDRGAHVDQLKGGLPTIQVRDLRDPGARRTISCSRRSAAASTSSTTIARCAQRPKRRSTKDATLFPGARRLDVHPGGAERGREKGFIGDRFFTAPNPPFGAVFTYYLKDELKTARKTRLDAEKEKQKKGEDTPYPSWDALRAEDREEDATS